MPRLDFTAETPRAQSNTSGGRRRWLAFPQRQMTTGGRSFWYHPSGILSNDIRVVELGQSHGNIPNAVLRASAVNLEWAHAF
jgi:hypothetical protein